MSRSTRVGAVGAWLAVLSAAIALLHLAGHGGLAPPSSPARARAWLDDRGGLVAAFAVVRVAALGPAWYLLATTFVGLGVRVTRARPLAAAAERMTPAVVRRLLALAFGAGVGTAALAGAALADDCAPDCPAVVTMHRLPDPPPAPAASPLAPAPAPPPAPPSPPAAGRWEVRPGDSFWTIAAHRVAEAAGHAPSDAEIAPYWLRLIAANRSALADPANPDLVFPGQSFALPPV